jgi:UDP-glucose 4-epimerase
MSDLSHALVTGGAGFIGSHLTRALLASGRGVTVLDNLSVGRREAVPEGARFVHGDVRDPRAVADALDGVDAVFHLAAQVTIRGSFDRFYEDLDTNVMGTARLLQAVDPSRVRWFVLASSMAVYADTPAPQPIDEQHATRPLSPYGIGKLTA